MTKPSRTFWFAMAALATAGLTCVIGAYTLKSHLLAAGLQAPSWDPAQRQFVIDDRGIAVAVEGDVSGVTEPAAAPAAVPAAESPRPAARTQPVPPSGQQDQGPIVLYYGEGCPHCTKVLDYLGSESVRGKLPVAQKEVWHDKANGDELLARAADCGISKAAVGVPLLWTGSECLSGDGPIIDYLKKLAEAPI